MLTKKLLGIFFFTTFLYTTPTKVLQEGYRLAQAAKQDYQNGLDLARSQHLQAFGTFITQHPEIGVTIGPDTYRLDQYCLLRPEVRRLTLEALRAQVEHYERLQHDTSHIAQQLLQRNDLQRRCALVARASHELMHLTLPLALMDTQSDIFFFKPLAWLFICGTIGAYLGSATPEDIRTEIANQKACCGYLHNTLIAMEAMMEPIRPHR